MNLWRDKNPRSPSAHMAVDEAILRNLDDENSGSAYLRFYTWTKPAVTIGFFMPYSDGEKAILRLNSSKGLASVPETCRIAETVSTTFNDIPPTRLNRVESPTQQGLVVRRLTGGGIVEHGEDVTFSLVAGKSHPLSAETTTERYRLIHLALRDALVETGMWPNAELVPIRLKTNREELACFSNPVGWDIVDGIDGPKIAGGAQRNSRGAWLHQGTVRLPEGMSVAIDAEWTAVFSRKLGKTVEWHGNLGLEAKVIDLEKNRYLTKTWNERV